MKKLSIFLILLLAVVFVLNAQPVRKEFRVPNVKGFTTLKCDFHMHTVFSDGSVWPTVRVSEAWAEGLDVIAITDHLEYQIHKEYVKSDHNASYEIAKKDALQKGIILIPGVEITKSMPPGHFNALFVKDASKILNKDYKLSMEEAKKQGAYVLWNHPGWKAQSPEGAKWMDEHEELFKNGFFHGIEVSNELNWYPTVLDWAVEKGLTIFSNTDAHGPMKLFLQNKQQKYRPMTLVFAKERNADGVRNALEQGRTVGVMGQHIFAKKEWAEALFYASVSMEEPFYFSKKQAFVKIANKSDLSFVLKNLRNGKEQVLEGGTSQLLKVPFKENDTEVKVNYEVVNIYTGSNQHLTVSFTIKK